VVVKVLTVYIFLIYKIYLGCVIQILSNGYDMHKEAHMQSRKD